MNYYNEIDPYCCQWLANLMCDGLIPEGKIDQRSIADVKPRDLDGYSQCHFFAGIAGWPLAMQFAGWPEDSPVWTGSCPCQPFSQAGKRKGTQDKRHLWPDLYRLIKACHPSVVMGEQVASKDGLAWLDGVYADCEASAYAVWACDTCAASVGAPHIRQRIYWVAESATARLSRAKDAGTGEGDASEGTRCFQSERDCHVDRLANAECSKSRLRIERQQEHQECRRDRSAIDSATYGVDNSIGERRKSRRNNDTKDDRIVANATSNIGRLGDSSQPRQSLSEHQELPRAEQFDEGRTTQQSGGAWSDFFVVRCRDDKARRISSKSSDGPLAHGVPTKRIDPRMGYILARLSELGHSSKDSRRILRQARQNRIGRLKAYGNAIVPDLAAEFITAYMGKTE